MPRDVVYGPGAFCGCFVTVVPSCALDDMYDVDPSRTPVSSCMMDVSTRLRRAFASLGTMYLYRAGKMSILIFYFRNTRAE